MDFALLDDAFPAVMATAAPAIPAAGDKERKKSKKSRNLDVKTIEMPPPPAISTPEVFTAPDRRAYQTKALPKPMKSADDSLPPIIDNFSPKMTAVPEMSTSSWFGAGDDEEEGEYMPYTGSSINESEYMLQPDFSKTFIKDGNAGLDRAGGIPMKAITMDEQWKIYPGIKESVTGAGPKDNGDLAIQLRDILKRLDHIEERAGAGSENSNMEVLMFTMSGIFVMWAMDIVTRVASR
jgi:hypothetical protein